MPNNIIKYDFGSTQIISSRPYRYFLNSRLEIRLNLVSKPTGR